VAGFTFKLTPEQRAALALQLRDISLPDELWDLPHMVRIREAAHAVGVKPEGLAAACFNRAGILAGPRVLGQPNPQKSPVHLGAFYALVAFSGAGSNTTMSARDRLMPIPAALARPHLPAFVSEEDVEEFDFGFQTLRPANGSALLARMLRKISLSEDDDDIMGGQPGAAEFAFGCVPRVELSYSEGAVLLSAMSKSSSRGNQALELESNLLDAYVGDEIRNDTASDEHHRVVPAQKYVLGITAYYQGEIFAEVAGHTTGFYQRNMIVPVVTASEDEAVLEVGRLLSRGQDVPESLRTEALGARRERPEFPESFGDVVDFCTRVGSAEDGVILSMPEVMEEELMILASSLSGGLTLEDPRASHATLALYRVAAQSALMRCSYEITEEDWAVARGFGSVTHRAAEVLTSFQSRVETEGRVEEAGRKSRAERVRENADAMGTPGTWPDVVVRVSQKITAKCRIKPLNQVEIRDRLTKSEVTEWEESCVIAGGEWEKEKAKGGLARWTLRYAVENKLLKDNGEGKYVPC